MWRGLYSSCRSHRAVRRLPSLLRQTGVSCQTGTMKRKIRSLVLLLLNISLTNALTECDFEKDECGWFSGSDVGEGSFVRTTSEEQKTEGTDLYPSANVDENGNESLEWAVVQSVITGHFMFAHSNSENQKFSLTSPGELNSTCVMFIFNTDVSSLQPLTLQHHEL